MNIIEWSKLTTEQQIKFVNRQYDVLHIENVIAAMQHLLGCFELAKKYGEEFPDEYAELFEMICEDDIVSVLDLFSARYNEIIEAGYN